MLDHYSETLDHIILICINKLVNDLETLLRDDIDQGLKKFWEFKIRMILQYEQIMLLSLQRLRIAN